MIDYEDRRKIRRQLPMGSCLKISKMAGVSPSSVSRWFGGKRNIQRVENAVLKLLAKLNRERDRKMKAAGLI